MKGFIYLHILREKLGSYGLINDREIGIPAVEREPEPFEAF